MSETRLRRLQPMQIVAVAFSVCNAWAAIGGSLALGVSNGGPVTLVYGVLLITSVYVAIAATAAELVAQYPTAGGQYHWTTILAPQKWKYLMGYICACINMIGWIQLIATACIVSAQIVCGLARVWHQAYTVESWHVFVCYQGFNVITFLYCAFFLPRASWTHNVGFVLSLATFISVVVTSLLRSEQKEPSAWVWTAIVNKTGWPSGIAVLTGLVNINFGYAGLDGAIHLAEDCANAAQAVPWALMASPLMNLVTVFAFLVATLYCVNDFEAVTESSTRVPLLEMWLQSMRSDVAASIFIAAVAVITTFAAVAVQQTASRLTWSFARDDALLGAKFLKRTNGHFQTPVWALAFNSCWVAAIGFVYLGSTSAFNAIVNPAIILEQVSFAIPAALLLWHRRDASLFPSKKRLRLGRFGWLANGVCVFWALFEVIFYNLPVSLPVTGANMNYSVAVLAAVAGFVTLNWLLHGRHNFKGPTIDPTDPDRSMVLVQTQTVSPFQGSGKSDAVTLTEPSET